MTDEPGTDLDDTAADDQESTPESPPERMGLGFYAALGLVLILVLMILVFNYPAARANAGMEMTKANWTLHSLVDTTGILIPVNSGTVVTAVFDREGRLGGNAGCNRYSAAYQTRDYNINITGVSQTKMFCQDPGVMEQESAFLADLSKVSSFRVSGSSLKFYDDAGKTVLAFMPE